MGSAVSKISQPTDQELTGVPDPAAQHKEERVFVSRSALVELMELFNISDAFAADLATQHEDEVSVSVSALDSLIAHVNNDPFSM